jgi:hypothetical protein
MTRLKRTGNRPKIVFGMTALSKLQVWTQPVWLLLMVAPFVAIVLAFALSPVIAIATKGRHYLARLDELPEPLFTDGGTRSRGVLTSRPAALAAHLRTASTRLPSSPNSRIRSVSTARCTTSPTAIPDRCFSRNTTSARRWVPSWDTRSTCGS